LRFFPGIAVAGCLKPILHVILHTLIPGISVLVCFGVRAQSNIEILYEYGEPAANSYSLLVWLVGSLLLLGFCAAVWFYLAARRQLEARERQFEKMTVRLKEAQSIARIGSWERDFETGETFWSAEALALLGVPRNSDILQHYERLVHPDDVDLVTETIASAYFKGGSYQCDHRVLCPDGREKYLRLAGQVFVDKGQSPVRETGTLQDITDRKLIEMALQKNEQKLHSILDAVPYPILILESGNNYPVLYSNQGASDLFGLEQYTDFSELDTRALWNEPEGRTELLELLEHQNDLLETELVMKDGAGNSFWALVAANKMDFGGSQSVFLSIANISERKLIQQELERLATLDSLTGLLNRRSFFENAQKESRRALRYGQPFVLLMLDIDSFLSINDRYGHDFSDNLLKRMAITTRLAVREEDIVGRIGGEELCVLLVSAELECGKIIADRICSAWSKERFDFQGQELTFTVSIGVAQQAERSDSVFDVFERADRCLFQAKQSGRNRVVVHGDTPASPRVGNSA